MPNRLIVNIAALALVAPANALASPGTFTERLEVVQEFDGRVIGPKDGARVGVRSGFETGQVIKVGDVTYMFVNEMYDRPHQELRVSLWKSTDGSSFTRVDTLKESIPGRSLRNFKNEVWVTAIIFDKPSNRWNMFYVAYQAGKDAIGELHADYNGRVFRSVSAKEGMAGIEGPYIDVDVVLGPDPNAQPWEGNQSVGCFHPYAANGRWYAFYCSHWHDPFKAEWPLGVAVADDLFGPWRRAYGLSPSTITDRFGENPIVSRLKNGKYLAVFDVAFGLKFDAAQDRDSIGYSVSEDGVNWPLFKPLDVQPKDKWSRQLRTPLGMIEEDDGTFSLYYTAQEKDVAFWSVDRVKVALHLDQ